MTIYATLMVVFLITVLVLVTFTVVATTSAKSKMYDEVVRQRDALDKFTRDDQTTQNELQELTDEELRKRALGRW